MKYLIVILTIVPQLLFVGCAQAISPSREAYILAKEHGWIELSVKDTDIPESLPPETENIKSNTIYEPSPPYCTISIKINNETFVHETIYPFGDVPPYKVDSGFRFPVPTGEIVLSVDYSGCDIENNEPATISDEVLLTIENNKVTSIQFDGTILTLESFKENKIITLEDINNRLIKIEHFLEEYY